MDATDPRYLAMQELTAYWLAHPDASDTLEGICKWWLTGVPIPLALVEQALAWLTERGAVEANLAADGRVRYRLSNRSGSSLS